MWCCVLFTVLWPSRLKMQTQILHSLQGVIFSKMRKSFEDLRSIKFIWRNLYMHGYKQACLRPFTLAWINTSQIQPKSHVGTLALHCIWPNISCQHRQVALAHNSPTWCTPVQPQAQAEKETICIHQCQHIQSALLKTLAIPLIFQNALPHGA